MLLGRRRLAPVPLNPSFLLPFTISTHCGSILGLVIISNELKLISRICLSYSAISLLHHTLRGGFRSACSLVESKLMDMMLRKGNRDAQKEQSSSKKASSLFGVRRLFVGFGGKSLPDSDPSKSPTSPLDYKLFNLANPFCRSPRMIDSPRRSWECDQAKVGLAGALLERSSSSGILLGNRIKINISSPNIFPTRPSKFSVGDQHPSPQLSGSKPLARASGNQGRPPELGNFRSCFSDVGRSPLGSKELVFRSSKSSEVLLVESSMADWTAGILAGSLPTPEIEESEDYTRITTHGPNPKTTHIFGDCVLDCNPKELPNFDGKESGVEQPSCFVVRGFPEEEATIPSLPPDFLSYCYSCRKKLEESADIYMYRGEKAFCSNECREELISAEEREGNAANNDNSPMNPMFSYSDEIFCKGMAETATQSWK